MYFCWYGARVVMDARWMDVYLSYCDECPCCTGLGVKGARPHTCAPALRDSCRTVSPEMALLPVAPRRP